MQHFDAEHTVIAGKIKGFENGVSGSIGVVVSRAVEEKLGRYDDVCRDFS